MAKKQPVMPKSYAQSAMQTRDMQVAATRPGIGGRQRLKTAHPGVISVQRAISGKKR